MPGRPAPSRSRALKQPARKFVSGLPADDENVDEVKRLKDNARLVRFDCYNDDSRTSFLQISVERATPEVAVLSPEPALVDFLDPLFILAANFVLSDPRPIRAAWWGPAPPSPLG